MKLICNFEDVINLLIHITVKTRNLRDNSRSRTAHELSCIILLLHSIGHDRAQTNKLLL